MGRLISGLMNYYPVGEDKAKKNVNNISATFAPVEITKIPFERFLPMTRKTKSCRATVPQTMRSMWYSFHSS